MIVNEDNSNRKKVVSFDLGLLQSANNAKDNKMGMKLVRHIKHLRRKITGSQLKKLWELIASGEGCPAVIEQEEAETELQINLDEELVKHPYSKIYLQTLTLSYLLLDDAQNAAVGFYL